MAYWSEIGDLRAQTVFPGLLFYRQIAACRR